MNLDLNCDLGEGEPFAVTESLMRHITSANIACGSAQTKRCIDLAKESGVHIGAHPRHASGRGVIQVSPDEFEALLLEQVRSFGEMHHIKLHGSLYHATDNNMLLAKRYLEAVRREWPGVIIYARCGGLVERLAKECGMAVWGEAFADRRYLDDGTLMPRSHPGALITDVQEALAHAEEVVRRLAPQTLCVHSDTPSAPAMAEALKCRVREWRLSSRE